MNSFKRTNIKTLNAALIIGLMLVVLWLDTSFSFARSSSTQQAAKACFEEEPNAMLSHKPDEGWLLNVSLQAKQWEKMNTSDFSAKLYTQKKSIEIIPQDIQYKPPLVMHLYFDIEGSAFGPLNDKEDENNRLFWQSMFGESSSPWLTATTFPVDTIRSYCNCECNRHLNDGTHFFEESGSTNMLALVRNHAAEAFTCSHENQSTAQPIPNPVEAPIYTANDTNLLWIIFRWQSEDMKWLSKEATEKDTDSWVREIKGRYPMIKNQDGQQRVVVLMLGRETGKSLPFEGKIEQSSELYIHYLPIEELKKHDLHSIEQYITTSKIELPILLPRVLDQTQMKTAKVKITYPECAPITIDLNGVEITQSESTSSWKLMLAQYILFLISLLALLALIILILCLYCYKNNWFELRSKLKNIVNPSLPNQP